MVQTKTNAMRLLDTAHIPYLLHTYNCADGAIDGVSVAAKVGIASAQVFKTLVTVGTSKANFVFLLPVAEELDLKKAARAVGEKSVAMLPVADINKVTGYIRGGCSPIGMKKLLRTVLHCSAEALETMVVSGGRIGTQIELTPIALATTVCATFAPLCKE